MTHLQQQRAAQQQMVAGSAAAGAVGGPVPAMTPPTMPGTAPQQGNTPLAGGPQPIAGGGAPTLTTGGVQGQVPLGGAGVTAMQPKPFSGAPGGRNAHGGANPFSINPNMQPAGSGSGGGMKMDQYGNYYMGTDPNADFNSTLKGAGQLAQTLTSTST